ncbi:hypothetical protein BC332_11940 [Capsicum chinense]|nr:hypothetical protein BC332_11940 [Capsicum chinense]
MLFKLKEFTKFLIVLRSPSISLLSNLSPTRLQIDKAWKIVSTRLSGGKEREIVLGENEFKEFAVEVCADAVVECAGKEMLKWIPIGVLGIAGVRVVVVVEAGAGRGAGYGDGGLAIVVVIEATATSRRRG